MLTNKLLLSGARTLLMLTAAATAAFNSHSTVSSASACYIDCPLGACETGTVNGFTDCIPNGGGSCVLIGSC